MKQLLFMSMLFLVGTVGTLFINPFLGVQVYYLFAVMRPQYLWEWALRDYGEAHLFPWSFFVGIAAILAASLYALGFFKSPEMGREGEGGPIRFSPAHRIILLFGFWVFLTSFTARNTAEAFPWFVEYLKIFVMIVVSTILIWRTGQLWSLLVIATVAIIYVGYEVNYLYLVNKKLAIYHNGYGGLDNNGAGLMMAMGIPLCLFVFEGTRRWWRWFVVIWIPVLLHAVLLSYSRGAMVSLIVVSPLILLRSQYRRYAIPAAGLIALLLLPRMAGPEIQARFFSIRQYEEDKSAQTRLVSWNAAWKMALDYPLLGVGTRNAKLYTQEYGGEANRTIHSQYLQILADNGFPGLALYLLSLFAIWRTTLQARQAVADRDDTEAIQTRALASGVETAMAVFCVGALFLSLEVFELPYMLLLLGAQLALVRPLASMEETSTAPYAFQYGRAAAAPAAQARA